MRTILAAGLVLLIAAAPASAQDHKPVDVYFGFGWAFPSTNVKNDFNAGWNGTIGATYNITEQIGIQGEYMYAHMNGPDKTISVFPTPVSTVSSNGLIQSNHQMHTGLFDLIYKVHPKESPFGGYVLGGGGIYHRIVQLTTPSVGYATVCDPYWFVCYPAAVPVDQIIGNRSENDFGINFGGGVTFGHFESAKFYVEARYHYVWGKTINPTNIAGTTATVCPNGCTTNAAYFPLTFGVRW
jgi:hypothetical protein